MRREGETPSMFSPLRIAIYVGLIFFLLLVAYEIGEYTARVPKVELPKPDEGSPDQEEGKKRWIEQISWSPRVFLFHHFLSQEECDEIIEFSKPKISRSEVVGANGQPVVDSARTSSGYFIMAEDARRALVREVERRIAEWTHLPVENGEAFYVLRYQVGQRYVPHTDFFDDSNNAEIQNQIGAPGNRMATVLTCLKSPDEGGETEFPQAGIKIPCTAGNAILFWDMNPDVSVDHRSLHGGLPVLKGEKWAMTKWIRIRKFWDYA